MFQDLLQKVQRWLAARPEALVNDLVDAALPHVPAQERDLIAMDLLGGRMHNVERKHVDDLLRFLGN